MRKIALVLMLSVSLAGCAQFKQAVSIASLGTWSGSNPITKDTLYEIEASMSVVVAGLNAYKKSCIAGAVGPNCKSVVASIQTYTRQVPPLIQTLRTFVRKNDQVNAQGIYNTIVQLISNAKSIALANNVQVGS